MKHILEQTGLASRKWLPAFAVLVALATMAVLLQPAVADIGFRDGDARCTLAGSWRHEVADPPPGFVAYETFTTEGGSVEINHGPGGPSTSIGAWKRVGPRQFLATFYKQLFRIDANDVTGALEFQFDGTVKVRRLLTLSSNGNELTGEAIVEIYNPAGHLVVSFPPGPIHSTRLGAEPLGQ